MYIEPGLTEEEERQYQEDNAKYWQSCRDGLTVEILNEALGEGFYEVELDGLGWQRRIPLYGEIDSLTLQQWLYHEPEGRWECKVEISKWETELKEAEYFTTYEEAINRLRELTKEVATELIASLSELL